MLKHMIMTTVEEDIVHPESGEVIFEKGDVLSRENYQRLSSCFDCMVYVPYLRHEEKWWWED